MLISIGGGAARPGRSRRSDRPCWTRVPAGRRAQLTGALGLAHSGLRSPPLLHPGWQRGRPLGWRGSRMGLEPDRCPGIQAMPWDRFSSQIGQVWGRKRYSDCTFRLLVERLETAFPASPVPASHRPAFDMLEEVLKEIEIGGNPNWRAFRAQNQPSGPHRAPKRCS